ncbi:hypothetical protein FHY31_001886 [Xanthomonas euvesicatoria]|uniref:Uncharacterized protein n=1 Tax=Xanthomonas euvesicatoria TaxID=456327 RepID=A0AAW3U2U6_XANEU|nr:hypothetical protein [Xanthomonas euvesicatoria]MBB4870142.1 hypothetical protein [Xanthomonas euvesicatoria]
MGLKIWAITSESSVRFGPTHPHACVLLRAQLCSAEQACTGPQWPITDCIAQSSLADISHPVHPNAAWSASLGGACIVLSPPTLGLSKGP